MSLRKNLILLLILVIIGGYFYIFELNGGQEKEKSKKLINLSYSDIKSFDIRRDDIAISFNKIGENWYIEKPVKALADKDNVDAILRVISDTKIERVIDKGENKFSKYGLENPLIKLIIKSKKLHVTTIYFGNSNPTETGVYIRKNSNPSIMLINDIITWRLKKPLMYFRNKKILSFNIKKVKKIEIKKKNEDILCEKIDKGKWKLIKPIKFDANSSAIEGILWGLNSDEIKYFVDEAPKDLSKYGLLNPKMYISIWEENKESKLMVGGKIKDGYYAKRDNLNKVFLIDLQTFKRVFKKPLELMNRLIFPFNIDEVKHVEIKYLKKSFIIDRVKDGWKFLNRKDKIDNDKMEDIIWDIVNLKFEKIINNIKLGNPDIKVSLKGGDVYKSIAIWDNKKSIIPVKSDNIIYGIKRDFLDKLPKDVKDFRRKEG
jgi:hypothetical protein